MLADKATLDEELKRLRAEVAEAKKANAAAPDTHDYSEAETRDYFIDLLLKEAGWALRPEARPRVRVAGMPNEQKKGFVDYVLWGDDGKPLASGRSEANEARRARRSAAGKALCGLPGDSSSASGRSSSTRTATSTGCGTTRNYPPRAVQGFYKKAELELLIQRRTTRKPLADAEIDAKIVERYYQTRAIRRIGEAFENDHDRKALLVMATGAGKTRTVIALVRSADALQLGRSACCFSRTASRW